MVLPDARLERRAIHGKWQRTTPAATCDASRLTSSRGVWCRRAAATSDRGGHADSARKYLTQYVEMTGTNRPFLDRYYLAPALFRLGELYEQAADAQRATEYYGRFVDLWVNADPELQPRVAEARTRINHLNRSKQ